MRRYNLFGLELTDDPTPGPGQLARAPCSLMALALGKRALRLFYGFVPFACSFTRAHPHEHARSHL